MKDPATFRVSLIIAEALRRGFDDGDGTRLTVHEFPPPTVETPCVVLMPGGPGSFIEGPDGEAVTFCTEQLAWTAYLFFGSAPGDVDHRWYYYFAERIQAALKGCADVDLGDGLPGIPVGPRVDLVSPPTHLEYGGATFWAATADLSLPVELE